MRTDPAAVGGGGSIINQIYILHMGFLVACIHDILDFIEYIWNAPMVSLVLPTSDDTGSWGSPTRQAVYSPGPMFPPWFLVGNREAELRPTTFSSLLLFCAFLSFLFS